MNASAVLIDLIAERWETDAPVVDVAWEKSGRYAGFSLGDGTLVLASSVRERDSRLKLHKNTRLAAVPPQAPRAPLPRYGLHEGSCLALAADPAGGFLTGGDDGRLVHLRLDGTNTLLAHEVGAWIDHVAASPINGRAYASGRKVHWLGLARANSMLPGSVTCLAFDPAGTRLAISHHGGVTLLTAHMRSERRLTWPGYHRNLAWSPDGRYLVSGMEENTLHGWRLHDGADIEIGAYPGQPRSLSFSADGRFLVTSGSMRPVCWRFDPPASDDRPRESGITCKTPVSRVACHPTHPLIATGYHNGAVSLSQLALDGGVFIKGPDKSAVSAMTWSPDGRRLALGTETGELAIIVMPDEFFRFGRR